MTILAAFAEAQQRAIERNLRCPECGAVTRVDADDPRESVACWAADNMGIICTGRAVANPTRDACADLRQWQHDRRLAR